MFIRLLFAAALCVGAAANTPVAMPDDSAASDGKEYEDEDFDESFDLARMRIEHEYNGEGDEKFYYEYADERISPWHDVPFEANPEHPPVIWVDTGGGLLAAAVPTYVEVGPDGEVVYDGLPPHDPNDELFHFVCEIPKGTTAKYEIHKSEAYNPIIQDVKKGKPRFYPTIVPGAEGPAGLEGSLVNYGALAQTWEDPRFVSPETGFGGDNDPIDVLEVLAAPCQVGQVMRVRVLGCLALVDDDETDWKLIVVDADHADAHMYRELDDIAKHSAIPHNTVDNVREWFRNYKTPDGKPPNKFGLGEKAMGAAFAKQVARETHDAWRTMATVKCDFNGEPCWADSPSLQGDDAAALAVLAAETLAKKAAQAPQIA